ncbi:MAG: hypothetical protein V7K50_29975 [Nostoc sp.]|uniref:hypothetical protein n=1 Tax=Nostoc sp. TaxID=1180 RepID=UPI002FF648DC
MVYADSDRPAPNSPPHKVNVVANFRQKQVKQRLLTRLRGFCLCSRDLQYKITLWAISRWVLMP